MTRREARHLARQEARRLLRRLVRVMRWHKTHRAMRHAIKEAIYD